MTVEPRHAPGARWASGGIAVALVALLTGCAAEGADADPGVPSSPAPSPTPTWAEFGGEPLSRSVPSASPGASGSAAAVEAVEPVEPPESCAAAGVLEPISVVTDRLTEPQFTEVRTESRLECSWAGFSPDDGSEVVMVTYAPEGSVVEYPGHVPAAALGDPAFFTTEAVAELGGIASWRTGEMFSGADLHLPGMLVSISSNSAEVRGADLLDAVTATAAAVLPEGGAGAERGGVDRADGGSGADGA
jgi:hypothetical protein